MVKQVIITKDNITICMDASIYYRIQNPTKSRYRIESAEKGLKIMATSSLRVIGAMYTL